MRTRSLQTLQANKTNPTQAAAAQHTLKFLRLTHSRKLQSRSISDSGADAKNAHSTLKLSDSDYTLQSSASFWTPFGAVVAVVDGAAAHAHAKRVCTCLLPSNNTAAKRKGFRHSRRKLRLYSVATERRNSQRDHRRNDNRQNARAVAKLTSYLCVCVCVSVRLES